MIPESLAPHLVSVSSESGHVVLARSVDNALEGRPQPLRCRDSHARCSLTASTIDAMVACGSAEGSIIAWDTEAGLAKHYVQDEVRAGRC